LKAWLVHYNGHKVNWSKYAYDCTQMQMRKATQHASTVVNNSCSQLDSTKYDDILGDESMLVVSILKSFATIWILNQVAIVKRLMAEGRVKEGKLTPNYAN
jgi:hypothetical protein